MADDEPIVILIIGEGKTDHGQSDQQPRKPTSGVLPILVDRLCGHPPMLRVVTKQLAFLQKGKLKRKVEFEKRQAVYSEVKGMVFVVDTEGADPRKHLRMLCEGRDAKLADFPTAVGVAHPCIETWLLCDPNAIKRAMNLVTAPDVTQDPESLPAPQVNRKHNPKRVLADHAGARGDLASTDAAKIAAEIKDLSLLRTRCPIGFAPFAVEVETRIRPIFGS